jgi:hypothetical protein
MLRLVVLFILGYSFATFGDTLLISNQMTLYPINTTLTPYWINVSAGFASCFVGILYPLLDNINRNKFRSKWSKTTRCCGIFMAFLYALSKISSQNNIALSITACILSVGMWYEFDRTAQGWLVAMVVTVCGTFVISSLSLQGHYRLASTDYRFAKQDFMGISFWFPFLLFCSSVCLGTVGRQLSR